jgi:hypothetical protein
MTIDLADIVNNPKLYFEALRLRLKYKNSSHKKAG